MASIWPFNVIVGRKADGDNIVLEATDDGKLKVEASIDVTSSGSAIQDGVDGDIKATVKDYITGDPSKSNPLAVQLTDTSGTPINPGSGGTSGTFGAAFPSTGTPAGFEDASGDLAPVVLEADGSLPVTIVGGGGGGGAVTIADGADVTQGALADAAVYGDNNGSLSAKLRGLSAMFADVWSSADNWFRVNIENATLAVTQSGSWVLSAGSAIIGNVRIDQTTPGTTNGVVVTTALPAGNNNIGDVDVASVTGNVTVVQGTGTNLHVVVDTAPTTAVTNAGLTALNGAIAGTEVQVDVVTLPAVTGTVTANAGTNLNTSALALEAGGNLAAIATSVAILDDWDESDRAKVNPIVGQAGVQGGAGASSATTQRIAIATDANAVTAVGTVADDATTPGAPVMVGGMAKSPDGTDPGNVSAEDDVARQITDLNRRPYVNDRHPMTWHVHLDGSSAYTDQSIKGAPGAGYQLVITNIIGTTGAATALNFFLEEGSTKIFGPIYLEAVAGRGFCSGPIHLPITANTAVTLTSSASIAQSFDIEGFTQKV